MLAGFFVPFSRKITGFFSRKITSFFVVEIATYRKAVFSVQMFENRLNKTLYCFV